MKQTIDISPEKVAPIASAGIRFLSLETTLIPGNIKQQLAVLEVLLGGLSTGELILATPAPPPVESDATGGDKEPDEVPEKGREKLPAQPELSDADRQGLEFAKFKSNQTGEG